MLFCCYKRPHQKLSCLPLLYFILAVFVDSLPLLYFILAVFVDSLPLLYFILAVFVDSFEMSMIVIDDKSIFINFIIQIHLTNHVSDIIYHGLLFCISAKIIFQEKCIRIPVLLFHEQRESQRNCVLSTI